MKLLLIIFIWIAFVIINIIIAKSNDDTRRKRIRNNNPKQIEHFWYGLGYGILCAIPFYFTKNYWELLSLALLHLSVFPAMYNFYTGVSLFNLSKTSKAITDRIMVKLGLKSTKWVNIVALLLSLTFIFLFLLL